MVDVAYATAAAFRCGYCYSARIASGHEIAAKSYMPDSGPLQTLSDGALGSSATPASRTRAAYRGSSLECELTLVPRCRRLTRHG